MTFFLEIWYAAYDTYTQAYLCSQNLYAQIFHPGYWVLRFSFALTCSVSITFLLLWCPTISCYCPFFNLLVYYLHLVFFWCPLFPFPVLWVVCFSTTQHNYIFFHFYFFLHYHFLCSTVLCMFSLRTPLLFTCVILLSSSFYINLIIPFMSPPLLSFPLQKLTFQPKISKAHTLFWAQN